MKRRHGHFIELASFPKPHASIGGCCMLIQHLGACKRPPHWHMSVCIIQCTQFQPRWSTVTNWRQLNTRFLFQTRSGWCPPQVQDEWSHANPPLRDSCAANDTVCLRSISNEIHVRPGWTAVAWGRRPLHSMDDITCVSQMDMETWSIESVQPNPSLHNGCPVYLQSLSSQLVSYLLHLPADVQLTTCRPIAPSACRCSAHNFWLSSPHKSGPTVICRYTISWIGTKHYYSTCT